MPPPPLPMPPEPVRPQRRWQPGQIAAVVITQALDGPRAGHAGQVTKSADALDVNPLCGPVVVVAANGVPGVLADPLDARPGLDPVIHEHQR